MRSFGKWLGALGLAWLTLIQLPSVNVRAAGPQQPAAETGQSASQTNLPQALATATRVIEEHDLVLSKLHADCD